MRKSFVDGKGFVWRFIAKVTAKGEHSLLLGNGGSIGKEIIMSAPKPSAAVEAFYVALRCNVAAFEEKLPEFLREFPGEYVAIIEGKVIAHMPNWEDLVKLAQREYPNKPLFMERALPKKMDEEVMQMDTIEG